MTDNELMKYFQELNEMENEDLEKIYDEIETILECRRDEEIDF